MKIKPKRLRKGDKIAVVSLSSGSIGEESNIYRYNQGKKTLEESFELEVVPMPNCLKGKEWARDHPELRAKDLMDAFKDKSIKAIITTTGGYDTIRLLPYIDYDVIKNNPKVFMGFSDTTANHFMLNKAGLISFYGPALAVELSLSSIPSQIIETIKETLFEKHNERELKHFNILANDPIDWSERVLDIKEDKKGYEVLQGKGKAYGSLIGGCLEVLLMINGTSIWPKLSDWKNKILALEISDETTTPDIVKFFMLNLGAQGILSQINGIIVGRSKNGKFHEEYKEKIVEICKYYGKQEMPIIYNCHFGHAWLWNILPIGCNIEIDCENRKLTLKENCVE